MDKSQNDINWDDKYLLGVPLLDSQHKQLVSVTNELNRASRSSSTTKNVEFKKTIQDAVAYVKYHFSTEEQIMEKTAYPEYEDHKKLHAEFIRELINNAESFEKDMEYAPDQFTGIFNNWILSHITTEDNKLGTYLARLQNTGKLGKMTMKRKDDAGSEKHIILAVDDSKTQLIQFKNILSMYDLYTCVSPLQALEMVKNMEVDIILLDLGMAEMSGFDFLRHLKKGITHQIPVIIVSANSSERFVTTATKLGADDFISKPARPDFLTEKIEKQLEKAKKS